MTIYVDSLAVQATFNGQSIGTRYKLFTDELDPTCLIIFAARLGIDSATIKQLHNKVDVHFDITLSERTDAIRNGAQPVTICGYVKIQMEKSRAIETQNTENSSCTVRP